MPRILCEMPHCNHKDPSGKCQAELVELMFGLMFKPPGQGVLVLERCAQYQTQADLEEEDGK